MATLCVNIDHIATLRQARQGVEPDPVLAVGIVERAGSTGITVHLREDRRHIQDRDARLIREVVQGHLNLEMAATPEMCRIALELKPDIVTLVPERREEVTTEGGLEVAGNLAAIKSAVGQLQEAGITVSLFIDPTPDQVEASIASGAREVEFHTGAYAHQHTPQGIDTELKKIYRASAQAQAAGVIVNAGHGLTEANVAPVAAIPGMRELNIGHSIISRAVFEGLGEAVASMKKIIDTVTLHPEVYRRKF